MATTLEISLFGACAVRLADEPVVEIRGAKHRAMFALLATAPLGRRTRAYLQETLWGEASYESGHQNLRRALADLRKLMGARFETLIHASGRDVELDLDHVRLQGDQRAGPFLGDLDVRERAFADWVQGVRACPETIAALGRPRAGHAPLRMRPRISALPLSVPGGEADLRVLADWIAEEICRSISRSNLLTVISHLSGRAMAARMQAIADVRAVLDVDYLVTGTLRRARDEMVVDIDLIDMASGGIVWNRNLVAPAGGLAGALPDRLANVVRSIGRTVADAAVASAGEARLPDIADHQLLIAGVSSMHRRTLRDFLRSRQFLTEAALRDPHSSDIQAWLGKWYILSIFKGYSHDREGDAQRALDCTARALDLDPNSSFGLTIDGFVNGNILKNLDLADDRYRAALEINPNQSLSWLLRGSLMAFQDDGRAAIRATDMARRLSPIDPFGYWYDSLASSAHLAAGDYTRALALADRSLRSNDRHISTLRAKITALHHLGRAGEARAVAADLQRRFPDFSIDQYRRTHPSADHKTGRQVIDALSAAGIQ